MRTRSRPKPDLYRAAIDAAERVRLAEARRVEGLDDEIALLRLRVARQIEAEGIDHLPLRELELLVRALRARHQLTRQDQGDLLESLAGVLDGFTKALASVDEK